MNPYDPRLPIIAADAKVKTCHVFHLWHSLKETGKQFHRGAFAQFTGLEERHVNRMIDALESHDAMPPKRNSSRRASRLPDDWRQPQEWIDWAVKERRWEPLIAITEAENFANYWQSKSGKDATKLDWFKTWQNWVRNSRTATGNYYAPEKSSPADWIKFCEGQLRTSKDKDYRAGIEKWQTKLDKARKNNVVPIKQVS